MEITKREIIFSMVILSLFIIIGITIDTIINNRHNDKIAEYTKAVQIQNQELFQYALDTNIGNALVEAEIKAIDTVTYEGLNDTYLMVTRDIERYTRHTRQVKRGKTWHTEVYWTWYLINSETKECKEITINEIKFNRDKIILPSRKYIETDNFAPKLRYKYYGIDKNLQGTLFTYINDKTINNTKVYYAKDIDHTIKTIENNSEIIVFRVFWVLFTLGSILGFYYINNNWLE